jgi:hypothetical protein
MQIQVQEAKNPSFIPRIALQRKCDKCKEKELLQLSPKNEAKPAKVPPIVNEVLQSTGQPIDMRCILLLR